MRGVRVGISRFDGLLLEVGRVDPAGLDRFAAHEPFVETVAFGGFVVVEHFTPPLHARVALRLEHRFHALAQCGQARGPRGRAFGHRRVGVLEEQSFAGDAVEGGRLHPTRAVGTRVRTPVVGDGKENVRARGFRGEGAAAKGRQQSRTSDMFHNTRG